LSVLDSGDKFGLVDELDGALISLVQQGALVRGVVETEGIEGFALPELGRLRKDQGNSEGEEEKDGEHIIPREWM
jgi:hypothetical protein